MTKLALKHLPFHILKQGIIGIADLLKVFYLFTFYNIKDTRSSFCPTHQVEAGSNDVAPLSAPG